MYYLFHAAIAGFITLLSVVLDFSKHYEIAFRDVFTKLQVLDTFTQNYILLMFIFVITLRITYELLPIRKIYFPLILLVIVLLLPLPRIFTYLFSFTCISFYCSHETIDFIQWAKGRIRASTKK